MLATALKELVSSQGVMLLDRKVYSASGADPNHAVQRTGFPQVSVLDKNKVRSLQNMSALTGKA